MKIITLRLLKLLELIAYVIVLGSTIYYIIYVLMPFFGTGIYQMTERQIQYSDALLLSEEQQLGFQWWLWSIPIQLLLLISLVLQWSKASFRERSTRLTALAFSFTVVLLSLLSVNALLGWLID